MVPSMSEKYEFHRSKTDKAKYVTALVRTEPIALYNEVSVGKSMGFLIIVFQRKTGDKEMMGDN